MESEAQSDIDRFYEIARIMDLDLDKKTIQTLYNLIDCGVNPDALAAMIKEMKQLS